MSCTHNTYSSIIVGSVPRGQTHRSRVSSLTSLIEAAIWCLERRRQRRALLQLDDRMLADLGVSRSQAIDEAKKAFWSPRTQGKPIPQRGRSRRKPWAMSNRRTKRSGP
jgi:uncharacterized protein YjiS (DUF1127 family)